MSGSVFEDHCNKHLSAVVASREWKNKKDENLAQAFATPSDEAFCLVTLENNCNRWLAEAMGNPQFKELVVDGKKVKLWPKQKFTKQDDSNGRRYKGWNQAGIKACDKCQKEARGLRGEGGTTSTCTARNLANEEQHMQGKKESKEKGKKRKATENIDLNEKREKAEGEEDDSFALLTPVQASRDKKLERRRCGWSGSNV